METPDFEKIADELLAIGNSSALKQRAAILHSLRKVHTDAIESAAKHLESHGCYQTAATIRALATKGGGNGPAGTKEGS